MARKIAVRLEDVVSILREPFQAQARRELRALLRVARAAEAHILEIAGEDDLASVEPKSDPLLRALRALDRAGKGDDK
jgi:hypothetical protein